MIVLGIETSCDETSAAVACNGKVLSNIISSQFLHKLYGGIVPEIASRIHIQIISQVVAGALEQANLSIDKIDAIAVTIQPGLVGSLIVGLNFAKGLAIRYKKLLVPIDHIEGHLFSGFLTGERIEFPFVSLVVSGGHTILFYVESFNKYEMIGSTRDDAAGEAFDKIAKLLGLGYPGGPMIDKLARQGDPNKYNFPRGLINSEDFDFSFSGLKTSVRYFYQKNFANRLPDQKELNDICASLQEAIVEVLIEKSFKALEKYRARTLVIAGGVSANSRLRELARLRATQQEVQLIIPQMVYCMDNAAMIAYLGELKLSSSDFGVYRNLKLQANPTPIRSRVI